MNNGSCEFESHLGHQKVVGATALATFFYPHSHGYGGWRKLCVVNRTYLLGLLGLLVFGVVWVIFWWFLVAEVDGLWLLEFLRWFLVVFGVDLVILLVKNFAISGKVATFVTANEGYASWLKC